MAKDVERRRELIVGVFVLGSVAAAMAMIVAFGSQQNLFQRRYRVRAVFGNVSGLRVGAPVFVAGVNVGSVEAVRFVPASQVPAEARAPGEEIEPRRPVQVGRVEISLSIEDRFQEQIRADSIASIGSVGLLGDKSVDITVGSAGEAVVAPEEVLRSVDPLTLSDVIDQIAPIRDKLDKILGDVAQVTGNLTGEDTPVALPATDPLAMIRITPSMRATAKYFWIVIALFLTQILLGAITAHYQVEGQHLYGIALSDVLPYHRLFNSPIAEAAIVAASPEWLTKLTTQF